MFKKILVPCDGSDLARDSVFPQVEDVAKSMDAEVIILRVVRSPVGRSGTAFRPGAPEMPIPLPETPHDAYVARHPIYRGQEIASAEAEAKRSVAEVEAMLREKGIKARSVVLFGQPAEEIIDYAKDENADLIVMCTHGRSGLGRWVFGSVTEKVLRGAQTPVLVVRPEGAPVAHEEEPTGSD
ncbi:MAG TPA: universal stress protein [Chloroflexi bacterium]|nr:universal stress protein [Chloroflexota bacterium]